MSPFLMAQQQAAFNANNNSTPPITGIHPRVDLHSQVSSNEGSNSSDQRKKRVQQTCQLLNTEFRKCIIPPPAPQFGLYNQPPLQPNVDSSMLRLNEAGSIQGIGVSCESGFFVDHL